MNVLSFISWYGVHDTSAAIVCDGELVAAAEEERFSRVKHDSSVPLNAIDFCLAQAGLSMQDIDTIAFPELPYRSGRQSKAGDTDMRTAWHLYRAGHLRRRSMVHRAVLRPYVRLGLPDPPASGMDPTVERAFQVVRNRHGELPPLAFYGHHQAHAAAAYFTSGFESSAVLTVDGRGDPYATVSWACQGDVIRRGRAEPWSNSLGFFYRDCTKFVGLGEFAEGKMMGLASYGQVEALSGAVRQLLETDRRSAWYRYRKRPTEEVLGIPPGGSEDVTAPPYPEFAAAVQRELETAMRRATASARQYAGTPTLCLGGGVALNCSANGRLLRDAPGPVWAFAASGDAGLSVGAAMLAARDHGELVRRRIDRADWGPEFSHEATELALQREPRVTFHRSRSVFEEAADRLSSGEVIGWFQGRMELGPRALGRRSILADPRSAKARDRVNDLKGRERWRPLSPCVLAERAHDYFDLSQDSPFMLFAVRAREITRHAAPAVVHVDGTSRPQTVRREQNSELHALLEAFERRTAVPILLNTSFNGPGEPIVCTPADAIKSFLERGLDCLVCGDFVVTRRTGIE